MSRSVARDQTDEYVVRRYADGDRESVLSLFETAWEHRSGTDWFEWKYVETPSLSHVPITLAERDGEVVAAQGYLPYPVRCRDEVVPALKPVDALVHPDHRRKGLYSRVTRKAIETYRDREPAFFFNFPNDASLGAQEKLGWRAVDVVPMQYRLQRPHEFLSDDAVPASLERPLTALSRAYLTARDRLATTPDRFDIDRHSSAPAAVLESLYESHVPDRLHVYRDARFYRWVLDAPNYDHTVYVARCDDRPVAALVTRTETGRAVKLMDALPATGDHEAFPELLSAAVADNESAAVMTVANDVLPPTLLNEFGFVRYRNPILSRVADPTYLAVRPLERDGETPPVSRNELTARDNWRVSFLEVTD
ncbi:GNAT family N-acetyltransferase [Natronobacterium gregoryi]|uniref:GCN5-like N-acetyltransferase n=2 Tax=Natronobacterium gregoryi TaxID=44930 RepID=L0AHQ1_NATGS|nr:GNAT family N-acetyltransferase [Natronobacterium gregoryi]AFZ73438.1 hypothetical protein Natgr_2261 [Natronobacterium gregoryi SP2]ELY68634.1 GCN5-like N-acetyltransferase [Natronobacterium gregoryi SP2]PLK20453.1 GNAT family N-acetyltransferase [Natronobacterium gregoryi SP2]SFI71915.1 Acetyltransferase (GNAT) domain-containing protein [Natronobacterium gregoryi]